MKSKFQNIEHKDVRLMLRPRPADGHKGTFGHAALIVGSQGMAGAAILAAEACLRSGIGKLSICTPEANRFILQTTVPEAIIVERYNGNNHYDAVGIGPGIGFNPGLLYDCLIQTEHSIVLDADALNILGNDPDMLELVPPQSIMTPHPLEAQRMIGSSDVKDVASFAAEQHVYVVLKGHPTHICTPEGHVLEINVGNSGMATAGSGDVLTGIITGLRAQGYTPYEAAMLGVHLHGLAGDYAAKELGEHSMLARDIIRHLPAAFKHLANG